MAVVHSIVAERSAARAEPRAERLFFLIAGYLMVRSHDAHGPRPFVTGRLTRLGIPVLIFTILTVPIMMLVGAGR